MATDDISRIAALEALNVKYDSIPACGANGEYEGDDCWHDGMSTAMAILENLP